MVNSLVSASVNFVPSGTITLKNCHKQSISKSAILSVNILLKCLHPIHALISVEFMGWFLVKLKMLIFQLQAEQHQQQALLSSIF